MTNEQACPAVACQVERRVMRLDDALKWADTNSTPEAVARLRSRAVAHTLAAEVRALRGLLRMALDELNCGEHGDVFDRSHRCGKCDENIDRNGKLRDAIQIQLGIPTGETS